MEKVTLHISNKDEYLSELAEAREGALALAEASTRAADAMERLNNEIERNRSLNRE